MSDITLNSMSDIISNICSATWSTQIGHGWLSLLIQRQSHISQQQSRGESEIRKKKEESWYSVHDARPQGGLGLDRLCLPWVCRWVVTHVLGGRHGQSLCKIIGLACIVKTRVKTTSNWERVVIQTVLGVQRCTLNGIGTEGCNLNWVTSSGG
jgi:hypothetical protein